MGMEDLFDREQRILNDAQNYINGVCSGAKVDRDMFEALVNEYSWLLKLLRIVTRISDRTTFDLNENKLDLLTKVYYDTLTKVYNRRYMEEQLKCVIKTLSRIEGSVLSVLMIDIDFFKNYNDEHGHSEGDECLRKIAEILRESVMRPDDFVVRYGGEEFTVILPSTDEGGARKISERILENVRTRGIPHGSSSIADYVTVSVGATTGNVKISQTGEDYIKRADKALYMSKQSGRNKCTFINLEE